MRDALPMTATGAVPDMCPKCGRVPPVWHDESRGWYVSCPSSTNGLGSQCLQPGSGVFRGRDEAVAEWNRQVQGGRKAT